MLKLTCLAMSAVCSLAASGVVSAAPPDDRLVYVATNLLVDANVEKLTTLLARAKKGGYTGVLLADSKFGRLGDLPDRYAANCRKVKASAQATGIEIIPAVFPVGYSNDLLWNDPNLAEALPVRDAEFIVRSGEAVLVPDAGAVLPGGDMSDLKKWSWHDDTVVADAGAARIQDPKGKNARIVQKLTLKPYRQYHVSVRIKAKDFRGTPEIKALTPKLGTPNPASDEPSTLIYSQLGAKGTQDWTMHHAILNTLGHTEVNLYFGVWDGGAGTLWFDDAKIEEVGPLNVVRRAGAPVTVKVAGKAQVLVEGTDYEPIVDPTMGKVPWPGAYEVYHTPPKIKVKSTVAEGTKLLVSYHHVVTVNDGQVMICPSEPKTVELLRDQARRMHTLWGAKGYWMSHDEIRCMNQDESCRKRGLSAGAILADNTRVCVEILKEVNPGGRIYAWSDMFDPHHNAHGDYYLVRGSLAGAWEGLSKDVIVAAWGFGSRVDSMKFFADRGNPLLIAGYYDGPPGAGVKQITPWLAAVPRNGTLRGVMYTTWENRYDDLEGFAKAAWGR